MRKSIAEDSPTRLRAKRRKKYVERLIKLFGNECFYCTRPFDGDDERLRTLDHLIPLCRGGSHLIENLVLCCTKCNNAKADLTADEYVLTEGYHVRRAWSLRQRTKKQPRVRRVEVLRDLVVA